jgi:signal transduction histidine kinase
MELRDDSKATFDEAIGLSTYSNSRSGVLSYVSIFENLWIQSELYQEVKRVNEQLASANERLKVHDKMQNEFISIASHELRTPVQSILGFASLANNGQIESKEAYKGVLLEAHRLQQLTNDLLDVSRIESGTSLTYAMEKVRINEIILNVVNGVKVSLKEGVSIETKIGNGGGIDDNDNNNDIEIYADKGRITQAISNIVVNAVKFTASGTIIVESNVSNDKKRVEVKVSDTGSGIAEDILPNLFDKFVTKTLGNENKRGTGLGLYITKAIIDAHKGKIFGYNNKQGVGATFTIVIPSIHAAEKIR